MLILLLFVLVVVANAYSQVSLSPELSTLLSDALHMEEGLESGLSVEALQHELSKSRALLQLIVSHQQQQQQPQQQQEVDISTNGEVENASPPSPPACSSLMGCHECVANSCAWCISQRACRDNVAWMCQGDVDHVDLQGIGRHRECPSVEHLDALREERKKRKADLAKERQLLEELAEKKKNGTTASEGEGEEGESTGSSNSGMGKEEKSRELERRAALAAQDHGRKYPYEVLGVDPSAASGDIRRAYRKLSVQFHPDKNLGADYANADAAFKDIVAAFDIVGDPEKRAFFDDMGGSSDEPQEAFNTEEAYARFGRVNEGNFYQGHKLITPLTENLWEKRVGQGDEVWLVEFYAPWCGHCQQLVPMYKQVAEALEQDAGIEVGAVNCATQARVCGEWFGIKAYPTLLAINDKHGTRQEYHGNHDVNSITTWLRAVAKEWRWLFANANMTTITSREDFQNRVINSTDFWILVYMDGLDCSACKTAKTNALRLSASLNGYQGVRIGLVDCEDPESFSLCYEDQGLPSRPHAPVAKGYPSGTKHELSKGEVLYNSNEVEPHVALELLEHTVRLVLADKLISTTELSADGSTSPGYEKDKKDEEKKPPERPPEAMWNGPKRRDPIAWGGGGDGGGRGRPALGQ